MGKDQLELHRHSRVLFRRPAPSAPGRAGLDAPDLRSLHLDHLANIARLEALHPKPTRLAANHRPHAGLLQLRPPAFWLRHHAVPLDTLGRTALMLVADPQGIPVLKQALADQFDDLIPVPAPAAAIESALITHFGAEMTQRARKSVAAHLSCRTFDAARAQAPAIATFALFLLCALLAPSVTVTLLCGLALVTLLAFTALRVTGLTAAVRKDRHQDPAPATLHDAPLISMLVPLYREAEIGRHLLRRLCRLTYPRARLEVLLVLEADDEITRQAVASAHLPDWFRVVEVPRDGPLTTKPRAMNYALNFCRGEIIGIWDAEDAPEPDQLDKVASAFATAPPEVACLQGVLDFYNPERNWISRCFTLEYAGWFRVLLQGIAGLHLVVPLGGTTLFIRRNALEALGAWDAHNVTEDADLGVRLARAGYRTAMLPTATYEEANSHVIPWIKQRSRWLKGFMMTYLVHMRAPRRLLRELGLWRFLGVQAFFLGTLGQFLLAPALWSFWLVLLGLPHPAEALLSRPTLEVLASSLILFEALNLCIWICGARASGRPWLALWAVLMPFYFAMGCFAAYKALWEVFAAPFFWDKTTHGAHGGTAED
ncbi:glycosyltransferase family 2 protein [Arenibacterium sp. LLYu02]|uniref:glycosyltransferase family 2 protein n=1 Tax=Arenibacterium sp. LLYu02 TaxID=3404132 RepID=UPI003B2207FF